MLLLAHHNLRQYTWLESTFRQALLLHLLFAIWYLHLFSFFPLFQVISRHLGALAFSSFLSWRSFSSVKFKPINQHGKLCFSSAYLLLADTRSYTFLPGPHIRTFKRTEA